MPPDKKENINLLPSDLERKRQVIKQVIQEAPRAYTAAPNGRQKKASFWSRLFPPRDWSEVEKIVATKPSRLSTRPPIKVEAPINPPVTPARKAPPAASPLPARPPDGDPVREPNKAAGPATEDFGVNLLAGEYASAFVPQNQKSFFISAAGGAVLLLLLLYAGLFLYQLQKSNQVKRSQQANTELESAVASFSDLEKEDQVLGRKVAVIKELLANHISTRVFLEKLEAITIPEVSFLALASTSVGNVSVTARAVSYTALARQLTVLQEDAPWIKEVTVSSATLARSNQGKEEGVEFDMTLRVDPAVFKAEENK